MKPRCACANSVSLGRCHAARVRCRPAHDHEPRLVVAVEDLQAVVVASHHRERRVLLEHLAEHPDHLQIVGLDQILRGVEAVVDRHAEVHPEPARVSAVRAGGADRMVGRDDPLRPLRASSSPRSFAMNSSVLAMPSQTGRIGSGSSHQYRSSTITVSPPASRWLGGSSSTATGPGQPSFGSNSAPLVRVRVDELLLVGEHAGRRSAASPCSPSRDCPG